MSEADRQIAQAVQLLRRGDAPAAERIGRAVLAREGAHAGALLLLGMIEAERGNLDEAALHFEGAVVLQPQRPDAHFNLAVLRADQGRYDDAIAGFARTLALDPANEPAAASLADAFLRAGRVGNIQVDLGKFDDAMANFDRAVAMAPDEPFALWCRALLNLRLGNLSEGFRDYEQRLKGAITGARRELHGVEWEPTGSRAGPADRTLYVYGEQGFGDTIQFARYVPLLLERGHDVIFEAPPTLVALMRSLDPRVTVIAAGAPVPPYDAYCAQPSLPAKLGTTLETIPARVPYLRADTATAETWTARCKALARPRVGLCWSGSPTHERDLRRSIPLALFRKLIDEADATFVSLQKDVRPADAGVLSGMTRVTDLTAEIRDFNDTAALIESLDLVVSVDTSLAHLAGALGKPVWVLLPIVPDWRWMAARDDSPWYPTARLFRQTRSGDWPEVLERAAERLRAGI